MKKNPPNALDEPDVQRGLKLSTIAGSLGVAWFAVAMGMPQTMLLEALGASGVLIGLTATITQLMMLIQIPASFISEKMPRRKPVWFVTALLSRAVWILPCLLLAFNAPARIQVAALLITVLLNGLFGQLSVAPWLSWIADLVPDDMRSRFWSRRQGFCTLASLLMFLTAGIILDRFPAGNMTGFLLVFSAAAVFGIGDILLHNLVPEPPISAMPPLLPVRQRILAPFRNRDFMFFTLAIAGWMFGLGLIGPFWMVYLKQDFHVLYSHLSIILIATGIGAVVASFTSGYFMERAGARTFGGTMLLAAPLLQCGWFLIRHTTVMLPGGMELPQPVVMLAVFSGIGAGFFASFGVVQLNMLTALAPKQGRIMAMAVHSTLVGAISAFGPVLGGWIKDHWQTFSPGWTLPGGTVFSFYHALLTLHALLIWLLVLPLLLRIRKLPEEMCMRGAITHFMILTPLRAVRDIYNGGLARAASLRTILANNDTE